MPPKTTNDTEMKVLCIYDSNKFKLAKSFQAVGLLCIPSKTLVYVCLGVHINQKRVWGNNYVLLTECLFQHLYLFLFLACRCVLQNKGCVHRIVLKLKGKNISFKEMSALAWTRPQTELSSSVI